MNKPSRLFWFLVLAQASAVASVSGWRIVHKPPPRAAAKVTWSDIHGGLKTMLDMFAVDCGRYPTTAEGLQLLIARPANDALRGWHGPYLDPPNVRDPWGHDYVYRYPGMHNTNSFDLYSKGPDGISKSGGSDLDDINNWDPGSPHGGNFSERDPFPKIASLLRFIPFACAVWSIAMIFAPKGRECFARNRSAYIVWSVISVIAFIIFMSNRPPLYGR